MGFHYENYPFKKNPTWEQAGVHLIKTMKPYLELFKSFNAY